MLPLRKLERIEKMLFQSSREIVRNTRKNLSCRLKAIQKLIKIQLKIVVIINFLGNRFKSCLDTDIAICNHLKTLTSQGFLVQHKLFANDVSQLALLNAAGRASFEQSCSNSIHLVSLYLNPPRTAKVWTSESTELVIVCINCGPARM